MNKSETLLDLILNIGSIAGFISVIYQIHNNRLNRPSFDFTFEGSHTETYTDNNLEFCDYHFSGIIRNKSLQPNSIVRFYLTVWDNKKKSSVLRFGHGVKQVKDVNRNKLMYLPLRFEAKEAYKLNIIFNFPLTGTPDDKLLKTLSPIDSSNKYFAPKYRYEFLIEDTGGNLYDYRNSVFNREIINKWWTLSNYSKSPRKYLAEVVKIIYLIFKWKIDLLMSSIGFYK